MFRFTARFLFFCILLIVAEPCLSESGDANQENSQKISNQRELTERLEESIEQLRLVRSDYYTQKAQYDAQIQKARENHRMLKDELDELHLQEAESDKQILKYKEEVEDIKKELVTKTTLENVVHEQVRPFLSNQRTMIENGIPYKQKERLARLGAVSGSSDVNEPTNISAANQLENIWNYSLEELRIGRSSETYTARAKIGDDALPFARYFRVGHLILGYITEDGRQTAMWLSRSGQSDFAVIEDKKQSEQVRNAVEILDHHKPPQLVELPVSLNFATVEEDSSAAN